MVERTFPKHCATVLAAAWDHPPGEVRAATGLSEADFSLAARALVGLGAIADDGSCQPEYILVRFQPFLHEMAMGVVEIPPDQRIIRGILGLVMGGRLFTREQIIERVGGDAEPQKARAELILGRLLGAGFLIEGVGGLRANLDEFGRKVRWGLLRSMFAAQDLRVTELFDALCRECDITRAELPIEDAIVEQARAACDLAAAEVAGIFEIFAAARLITNARFTPSRALLVARIRLVGSLLAEVGHPLGRRAANMLLRSEPQETSGLCERMMISPQEGLPLLHQLEALGLLRQTTVRASDGEKVREYTLWTLTPERAIEAAQGYILTQMRALWDDAGGEQDGGERTAVLMATLWRLGKVYFELTCS